MAALALTGTPPEGIMPELWDIILLECHENRTTLETTVSYPIPQLDTLLAYLSFKGWSIEKTEQGHLSKSFPISLSSIYWIEQIFSLKKRLNFYKKKTSTYS